MGVYASHAGPLSRNLCGVAFALLLVLAGCRAETGRLYTGPQIAPDSGTIAYARVHYAGMTGLMRDVKIGPKSCSVDLFWLTPREPERVRQVHTIGTLLPGSSASRIDVLRFSPNGRRVLLGGEGFVPTIVDLPDGKVRRLDIGRRFGRSLHMVVAWRGDDEMAYVLRGDETLEIFRQGLDQPADKRTRAYLQTGERLSKVYLAPDGRWALLVPPDGVLDSHQLLDVTTGRLRPIDLPAMTHDRVAALDVAWQPDGRMVAIVVHLRPAGSPEGAKVGEHEALVILEPLEGDGSQRVMESMILRSRAVLGWTPDSRYLVLDSQGFCARIQPQPWQVMQLNDLLKPLRPLRPAGEFCRVAPLPLAGWLQAVDYRRKSEGQPPTGLVAVDYSLRHVVPLGIAPDSRAEWAASPDGRYVAIFDEAQGKVLVRPIDLPALPPASQPMTNGDSQ